MGEKIGLGVPYIGRERKLCNLLESVDTDVIDAVYVADNAKFEPLYLLDEAWPFDLEVIDLPYDCGIGKCRSEIVAESDEPYLFMADSDMEMPYNAVDLLPVLQSDDSIGAVSGILNEPAGIRTAATDFHRHSLFGTDYLVHELRREPQIEYAQNVPFARGFDKLPQCMLLKRECLNDYSWHEDMRERDHLDFFLGHEDTKWDFGVAPTVLFEHNKDADSGYRDKYRGRDDSQDMDRLETQYGVDAVVNGDDRWFGTQTRSVPDKVSKLLHRHLPPEVCITGKEFVGAVNR